MIQAFHKASQSLAFKILLGILAVSFVAMWGIGDMWNRILSPQNMTVATVGKVKIKMDDFVRALDQEMRLAQAMEGRKISPQDFARAGFDRMVLQNLIRNALVDQECDRLGLRIGDDLVAQTIRKDKSLKTESGEFHRDRFNRYLQILGLSEKQYLDQVRKDLRRQQLMSIATGSVVMPKPALDLIYDRTHQNVHLNILVIPFVPVSDDKAVKHKVSEPKDETLAKFFNENARFFKKPETRSFKIVRLSYDQLAGKVSDEEVKRAFEARYGNDKKLKFEDVKKEIHRALVREKNANAFEALRRKIDDKIAEGLSLDKVSEALKSDITLKVVSYDSVTRYGQMTKNKDEDVAKLLRDQGFSMGDLGDIFKVIFSTDSSQVSQITELASGDFVIVHVEDIKPSYLPDYKQVAHLVREVYLDNERLTVTNDLAQLIAKKFERKDRKAPLVALKAEAGQKLKSVAEQRYKLMKVLKDEGLEGYEPYIDTMNPGDIIVLPNTKAKSVVLLQVTAVSPHKGEPSEETRRKIIAGITKEMRRDAFESYLEHLAKSYRIDVNKKALEKSPLLS